MGAVNDYFIDLNNQINEIINSILEKYGYNFSVISRNCGLDIIEDLIVVSQKMTNENDVDICVNLIEFSINTLEKENIYNLKKDLKENLYNVLNESCKNYSFIFSEINNVPILNIINEILNKYGYDIKNIKTNNFEMIFDSYIKKYCKNKSEYIYNCILEYICYSIEINEKEKIINMNKELKKEMLNIINLL